MVNFGSPDCIKLTLRPTDMSLYYGVFKVKQKNRMLMHNNIMSYSVSKLLLHEWHDDSE